MKIIFVGGTGRCGKSVVAECLACHPDAIKLPFELRFLTDPDGIVDFYTSSLASWSPFLMDKRIKRLERLLTVLGGLSADRYIGWQFSKHFPTWKKHVNHLMQSLYDFSYDCKWVGMPFKEMVYHASPHRDTGVWACILGTFIREIITDLLQEHNKSIFISDDTWSVLFARELSELLPEIQFVNVYRDPRDVVSSMAKQSWCPESLQFAAWYYSDIMSHYLNRDPLYCDVRFEELIEHPTAEMIQICSHLEIELYDTMLEPLDLTKANIGRWKDEADQSAFELIMPIVKELGYETDD